MVTPIKQLMEIMEQANKINHSLAIARQLKLILKIKITPKLRTKHLPEIRLIQAELIVKIQVIVLQVQIKLIK